jgi:hypothetical protein
VRLLETLLDWLVVAPANVIAVLITIPLGFAPFIATIVTWAWVIVVYEDRKPMGESRYDWTSEI